MPVYSNNGQYQNAYPPVRRRRRRRRRRVNPLAIVLAVALLVGCVGVAWAILDKDDPQPPPAQSQTTVLTLPEGVALQQVLLADTVQPKAEDFVTGLDGTGISVAFQKAPGKELGEQTVTLLFSKGDAACTKTATLSVFHLESKVAVASGGHEIAVIGDFVPDESLEASFVGICPEDLDHSVCGDVTLTVACGGREYEVTYAIEDRTAPTAETKELTVEAGTKVDPAKLVSKITDETEVTVTYVKEPDLSVTGSHPVELLLTDSYGNTANVTSVIHVTPKADAPVFSGLTDIRILVGETVAYKKGVSVSDPQDGSLTFTVDPSGVNTSKAGTYYAYYTATDADGNTTKTARRILVEQIDLETVNRYAQTVLDKIITPDMTRDQKIFAVYKYTKENVAFVGTSDKTNLYHGAYEGFTTGKGDCYTYYAMNVIFFDLLGIENLEVARVGGQSNHWWNLVKYDDGVYYHLDSCPVAVKIEGIYHWKMTDTDLKTYTDGVAWRKPNFYTYDKTLPEYEPIEIAP